MLQICLGGPGWGTLGPAPIPNPIYIFSVNVITWYCADQPASGKNSSSLAPLWCSYRKAHAPEHLIPGPGEISLSTSLRIEELNTVATVQLLLRLRPTPVTLIKINTQLFDMVTRLEDDIQHLWEDCTQRQNMEGARPQNKQQLALHYLHNFVQLLLFHLLVDVRVFVRINNNNNRSSSGSSTRNANNWMLDVYSHRNGMKITRLLAC